VRKGNRVQELDLNQRVLRIDVEVNIDHDVEDDDEAEDDNVRSYTLDSPDDKDC